MVESTRAVPAEDDDTRPYWEAAHDHRLELQRCAGCGRLQFPPRPRCPGCLSTDLTWTEVSGRGHVYSFTIVYAPVVRGLEPPYAVAQVELDDQPGLCLVANIVNCDPEAVRVGMPVQVIFEDVDENCTLPQFTPVLE
jgi:uncharacterized protein